MATSRLRHQVLSAFLGETTREDFIPYTADFLLQIEDVKWTIVSGIVGGQLIVSVRNLGYSRNAGEFVKAASGISAAPAATAPWRRPWSRSSGSGTSSATCRASASPACIGEMAEDFLRDAAVEKKIAAKTE